MRKVRLVAAVALCSLAVVPARASTPGQPGQPNACQIMLDRGGDVGGALGVSPVAVGSGAPVDLRGVAIHTGLYGALTIDIAVADADARHELPGTLDLYSVHWRIDGHEFWAEAARADTAWAYQIRIRPIATDGVLDEYAIPAMGEVSADTIRIHTQETILGGEPVGARILTDVNARAERSIASAPVLSDTAPDTVDGVTAIPLDAPCAAPTATPVGVTAMCRTLSDPDGDIIWRASIAKRSAATDVTGVFVQSTGDRLVVELGVVDLRYVRADGVDLRYEVRFDIAAGETVVLTATWAANKWDFDALRVTTPDRAGLTVAGSAGQNRIRFELAAHELAPAFDGMPFSNFSAEARQTDLPSTLWNVHDVADAPPGTDHFTLGTGCP